MTCVQFVGIEANGKKDIVKLQTGLGEMLPAETFLENLAHEIEQLLLSEKDVEVAFSYGCLTCEHEVIFEKMELGPEFLVIFHRESGISAPNDAEFAKGTACCLAEFLYCKLQEGKSGAVPRVSTMQKNSVTLGYPFDEAFGLTGGETDLTLLPLDTLSTADIEFLQLLFDDNPEALAVLEAYVT